MLACASRTSAAVENCCRTPPIALEVAPAATPCRSAMTTSRAPREARWYATDAPMAPAPATTIRATRPAPASRLPLALAAATARLRAPARRGGEVRELRVVVERVVRRADRRDAGSPRRCGVLAQRHGLGGRLRAGVDDHGKRPLQEDLRSATALRGREQDPLTRRPERED